MFRAENPEEETAVFYWSRCPLCPPLHPPLPGVREGGEKEPPLRRCAGCHLLFYCGKEHQRCHWPSHRPFCKAVAQGDGEGLPLLRLERGESLQAQTQAPAWRWREARAAAALVVELRLRRRLSPNERLALLFPRACEVCKEMEGIGVECLECRSVVFCSDVHRLSGHAAHATRCAALALCRRLDLRPSLRHGVAHGVARSLNTLQMLERIVSGDAGGDAETSMEATLASWRLPMAEAALCSELLSCPLTLAFALRALPWPPPSTFGSGGGNGSGEEVLEMHVVGAAGLECCGLGAWEMLLHALPPHLAALRRFALVFVGPDIPTGEGGEDGVWEWELPLCDACLHRGRSLAMRFRRCAYERFATSGSFAPPIAVAAFNCGFSERPFHAHASPDPWPPAWRCFVANRRPRSLMLFTSYTADEANRDWLQITTEAQSIEPLLCKVSNPFASLRPHRDWEPESTTVFYCNAFASAFVLKPASSARDA